MFARNPPIGAPPRPRVVTSSLVLPTRRLGRTGIAFPRTLFLSSKCTGTVREMTFRSALAFAVLLLPATAHAMDCLSVAGDYDDQGRPITVASVTGKDCGPLKVEIGRASCRERV